MIFDKFFKGFDSDELDWDYIMTIPEFQELEKCEQPKKWHSEGNVLIHTKMVVNEIRNESKKFCFDFERRLLIMAALFHDIGKPKTATFSNGEWHMYGHEIEGERITRRILWDEHFFSRETVCSLVRYHMFRYELAKSKNRLNKLFNLSYNVDLRYLVLLWECDCRGSLCENQEDSDRDLNNTMIVKNLVSRHLLDRNYHSLCIDERCYGMSNDTSREIYDFINNKTYSDSPKVYVMIGISGAGKDTYISSNLCGDAVILSRDIVREKLGLCQPGQKYIGTTEEENRVTEVINEMMDSAIKDKKDIVINNMNTRRKYRDEYHALLDRHGYKFVYYYIEAPTLADNIKRRMGQINENVFLPMIEKIDFPTADEYDEFIIYKQE